MEEQRISDNRPITERIKTFEDALDYLEYRAKELADQTAYNLSKDWYACAGMMLDVSNKAYLQLAIITYALNEGWQPEFTEDEERWHSYFMLWTEDEVFSMSEEDKDKLGLCLWGGSSSYGSSCGLAYAASYHAWSASASRFSARLFFRNSSLAEYAGRQFITMYAIYLLGDKGLTAKPWREFEKEIKKKP